MVGEIELIDEFDSPEEVARATAVAEALDHYIYYPEMPADIRDALIDAADKLNYFFYGSGHVEIGAVFSCVAPGVKIAREEAEELRLALASQKFPARVKAFMLQEAFEIRQRLRERGDNLAASYFDFLDEPPPKTGF